MTTQLSPQGTVLMGILAEWFEQSIPFDPRLATIISKHLSVPEQEQWLVAMTTAQRLQEEHPDYDRLHQSQGADRDYGLIGRGE